MVAIWTNSYSAYYSGSGRNEHPSFSSNPNSNRYRSHRHEEYNAVLRMNFKKPKAPRRPPPGYSKQVAARLRQNWLDSLPPEPERTVATNAYTQHSQLMDTSPS